MSSTPESDHRVIPAPLSLWSANRGQVAVVLLEDRQRLRVHVTAHHHRGVAAVTAHEVGGETHDAGRRLGDGPERGDAKQTGFRTYGKSKDSRDDLPQIVIGMAVTLDGIPVRCWC